MFKTSDFRSYGRESCFGRRVAVYRIKAKGQVTVYVCENTLETSYGQNSSKRKLHSIPSQVISLLQAWVR